MWLAASSDAKYYRKMHSDLCFDMRDERQKYLRLRGKIESLAITAGIIEADADDD